MLMCWILLTIENDDFTKENSENLTTDSLLKIVIKLILEKFSLQRH